MKASKRFGAVFLTVLVMMVIAFSTVNAQGVTGDPVEDVGLTGLLETFAALGGVGSIIAVIVNILKTAGIVKDGKAAVVSTGLNLLALVLLYILGLFGKMDVLPQVDGVAGSLANVLAVVFGFVWQLWISRQTHNNALKGVPIIGKSWSAEVG